MKDLFFPLSLSALHFWESVSIIIPHPQNQMVMCLYCYLNILNQLGWWKAQISFKDLCFMEEYLSIAFLWTSPTFTFYLASANKYFVSPFSIFHQCSSTMWGGNLTIFIQIQLNCIHVSEPTTPLLFMKPNTNYDLSLFLSHAYNSYFHSCWLDFWFCRSFSSYVSP